MKKILTLIAILAVAFNFVACDNTAKEQNAQIETIKSEVMKIHDDAMAKMGDLGNLESALNEKIATIKNDTTMAADSVAMVKVADYERAINNLNSAKAGMMSWMNNFTSPSEEATFEEKITFYKSEIEKVNTVMENINSSISTAEEIK